MTDDRRTRGSRIRDRQVLLVAAGVVAFVLALRAVSAFVPALDDALGFVPVLILAMVAVTAFVLWRAVRPRRPAG